MPRPLDPEVRSTLRDLLDPPPGFHLGRALGTAYSLDAETLMAVPLFASGLASDQATTPLGITRIYDLGRRIHLLVQGDRISISRRWATSRPLLRLMGEAVVPCSVAHGSFHPKVLVLEFVSDTEPARQHHRVVISTRNLTMDNSWDSTVVLEEDHRGVLVPGLEEAIVGLAEYVNDPNHESVGICRTLGQRLGFIRFQSIRGLEDVEVALLCQGSPNAERLLSMLAGDDLLVVSPFVTDGMLRRLADRAGLDNSRRWLVTRPVDVPASAFSGYQVFQIAVGAVPAHERPASDDDVTEDEPPAPEALAGLHAKFFIASSARGGTRVVVTSANATASGWRANVEIAVTGRSRNKAFKVPMLLETRTDPEQDRTFGDLLVPIPEAATAQSDEDPPWEGRIRGILASATLIGTVILGPPRTLQFSLMLPQGAEALPEDLRGVSARPFGYTHLRASLSFADRLFSGSVPIGTDVELVPFANVELESSAGESFSLVLAMRLEGDVTWSREDARHALVKAARPQVIADLLWYLGAPSQGGPKASNASGLGGSRGPEPVEREPSLPVLERVLLRVHGPRSKEEIATIDGILAGLLENPDEYTDLIEMWRMVKDSL